MSTVEALRCGMGQSEGATPRGAAPVMTETLVGVAGLEPAASSFRTGDPFVCRSVRHA